MISRGTHIKLKEAFSNYISACKGRCFWEIEMNNNMTVAQHEREKGQILNAAQKAFL